MPMDDTPPEQLVVPLATKCTGDVVVLPPVGEDTDTMPKALAADRRMQQNTAFISTPICFTVLFYSFVLQSLCYLAERRERNRKIHYVSHEHPTERRKSQKLSASVDGHLLTFNAFVKYLVHLQCVREIFSTSWSSGSPRELRKGCP